VELGCQVNNSHIATFEAIFYPADLRISRKDFRFEPSSLKPSCGEPPNLATKHQAQIGHVISYCRRHGRNRKRSVITFIGTIFTAM
jgi:hypothetical protein